MTLTKETAAEFELAVDRQYWYELVMDDLPMWGMVGEVLRDDTHGRMEKVCIYIYMLSFNVIITIHPTRALNLLIGLFITEFFSSPLLSLMWFLFLFFSAYLHTPQFEHIIQPEPHHRGESDF